MHRSTFKIKLFWL